MNHPDSYSGTWVTFIVGLLIATFVGGGVRTFLAPQQLAQWVEQKMAEENPKFSLSFERIEFVLAEGIWPRFGLRLQGLEILARDRCVTRSRLFLDELYVPVKIFHLLLGHMSFSNILAKNVKFYYLPVNCNSISSTEIRVPPSPVESSQSVAGHTTSSSFYDSIKKFFATRFEQELANSREWFEGLEVDRVTIYRGEAPELWFTVSQFRFDLLESKNTLLIEGRLDDLKTSLFTQKIDPMMVSLDLSQEYLVGKAHGRFKEGETSLALTLKIPEESYNLRTQVNYLPVGEVLKVFPFGLTVESDVQARRLWFSCVLMASGQIKTEKSLVLRGRDCGLSGEAGRVVAKDFTLNPYSSQKVKPFKVQIERFSVKYLLETFGKTHVANLITQLGRLSGTAEIKSLDFIKFVGEVEKLELVFSNKGKKRLQPVESIKGELQYQDQRLSGLINDVNLSGGQFKGEISFNLDKKLESGLVRINLSDLKFNEQIDQLILGGRTSGLQVYGQAKVNDGVISSWRGHVGWPLATGKNWKLTEVKMETKYENQELSARLRAGELVFSPNHYFYEHLQRLLFTLSREKLFMKDLDVRLKVNQEGGEWNRLKVYETNHKAWLTSSGQWKPSGSVNGWINMDYPKKKLMAWELGGSFSDLEVIPTFKLLKTLVGTHSGIELNEQMSSKERITVLQKILKESKGTKQE